MFKLNSIMQGYPQPGSLATSEFPLAGVIAQAQDAVFGGGELTSCNWVAS